jgi:uncharacterized OB-fold protein
MGFEKFGTVSFTTEARPVEFINQLEKGKVVTTRCKKCDTTYFPPKADCPSCLSSDVEWVEITGKGKLQTFAKVLYGPTGFESDQPYTLAIVDFGKLRVFGRMSKDVQDADVKIGMEVTVAPVKYAGDRIAYEFKKV